MPLDNGKIQVTWEVACWLIGRPIRPTSLKLLFAMLHQQDLRTGWPAVEAPPQRCWATLKTLRHRVGPRGANDARAFRALCAELREQQLVTHCAFVRHGARHALQWEFVPAIFVAMAWRAQAAYVLLDLEELGRLRTRPDITLYVHLRRAWGKKAPQLEIKLSPESWSAEMRRYARALPRLATLLGARFHVALAYRTDAPLPDRLIVKVEHANTTWFDGALDKAPPEAKRWTVGPDPEGTGTG